MKNGVPSLVKWAGGKKQLLEQFEKLKRIILACTNEGANYGISQMPLIV